MGAQQRQATRRRLAQPSVFQAGHPHRGVTGAPQQAVAAQAPVPPAAEFAE